MDIEGLNKVSFILLSLPTSPDRKLLKNLQYLKKEILLASKISPLTRIIQCRKLQISWEPKKNN